MNSRPGHLLPSFFKVEEGMALSSNTLSSSDLPDGTARPLDPARAGSRGRAVPSGRSEEDKVLLERAIPSSTLKKDGSKWPGLEFINHQFEEVHPASHSVRERLEL